MAQLSATSSKSMGLACTQSVITCRSVPCSASSPESSRRTYTPPAAAAARRPTVRSGTSSPTAQESQAPSDPPRPTTRTVSQHHRAPGNRGNRGIGAIGASVDWWIGAERGWLGGLVDWCRARAAACGGRAGGSRGPNSRAQRYGARCSPLAMQMSAHSSVWKPVKRFAIRFLQIRFATEFPSNVAMLQCAGFADH